MVKTKEKDTMIRIAIEVRKKLKMQALKVGLTLKEYISRLADKNN